jgi:hypothetical protein
MPERGASACFEVSVRLLDNRSGKHVGAGRDSRAITPTRERVVLCSGCLRRQRQLMLALARLIVQAVPFRRVHRFLSSRGDTGRFVDGLGRVGQWRSFTCCWHRCTWLLSGVQHVCPLLLTPVTFSDGAVLLVR